MKKKTIIFFLIIILAGINGCSTKKPTIKPRNYCGKEFKNALHKATIGLVSVYKFKLSGIYENNDAVVDFIDDMVLNHNCNYNNLVYLFNNMQLQLTPLKIVAPKVYFEKYASNIIETFKEKPKTAKVVNIGSWDRYEKFILTKKHINEGAKFWLKYENELQKAYEIYGVAPEYILGILGVETIYGINTGKFLVFDTLATLAFEKHRRSNFFKNELKKFLLMTKSEKLDVMNIKGSYAGAIGLGQFMPSNFDFFGIDFDYDGIIDLWNGKDAIGSVAYYLSSHGWKKDQPVAIRASYQGIRFTKLKTSYKSLYSQKKLKKYKIFPTEDFNYNGNVSLVKLKRTQHDELWFGTKNFYVITRYNHSSYYAMGVFQLAQKVKEKYLENKKQY